MCKSLRFLGQQAVLHRLEAFFYILEAGMRAERKKEQAGYRLRAGFAPGVHIMCCGQMPKQAALGISWARHGHFLGMLRGHALNGHFLGMMCACCVHDVSRQCARQSKPHHRKIS
ncbi:hypothetical protein GBA52_010389 [Prunus armeniaca]|nr:hypothetical protein GBA52_010389 [Prunus armeniaca]